MTTQTGNKTKSKAPMVFDMTSNECIWSKAGVVAHRLCHNAFDCLSCSFDKAIQRKRTRGWHEDGLEQNQENYWTSENWQNTAPHKRYCRHMLTGRVAFKLCPNHYACARCVRAATATRGRKNPSSNCIHRAPEAVYYRLALGMRPAWQRDGALNPVAGSQSTAPEGDQ